MLIFRRCLAGTLVKTEGGYKAIEEIEVGDKVWSWDEATGEQALKTVVQLFRNEKDVLVHIDAAGEHIQTTLGHPFYVAGKGWVKAGELKSGDVLKLYDGKEAEINSVSIKESKPVITYNFEVEDSHTYYVTQSDVLCHNACHGNSLKTTKSTDLYVLRDRKTGLIKKIGQTTRGTKRYSNKFYNNKNVTMEVIDSGSKVQMRQAETDLLKTLRDYFPDAFDSLWNKGIH